MKLKRQIGLYTAILIIIADVVGTGIFMTTGNLLGMTQSAHIVLVLWGIGGLVALTGSLCYAELASMWPENGGEYVYLKNMYGLLPSFLTGWISLFVGFSASVAIAALTILSYVGSVFPQSFIAEALPQKIIASLIIVLFGIIHIIGVKKGSIIQNILTVLKLVIVFSIIVFGLSMADWSQTSRLTEVYSASEKSLSLFGLGIPLLMVMFAYSGWNGANYIAGEIQDPQKNLPRAVLLGVISITIIYLLMNIVFLISADGAKLMGKDAVGAIATQSLFGEGFSTLFSIAIALILLSSVSVQMMVGPRVYQTMAEDRIIFHSLAHIHPKYSTPFLAIITQMIIAIIYVCIGKSNIINLLIYMGFSLNIFPLMSVVGLVYTRCKKKNQNKEGFKTPLFPLIPLIYIILTLAMMVSSLVFWTKTSLIALAMVGVGVIMYYIWRFMKKVIL